MLLLFIIVVSGFEHGFQLGRRKGELHLDRSYPLQDRRKSRFHGLGQNTKYVRTGTRTRCAYCLPTELWNNQEQSGAIKKGYECFSRWY
jgi:hypothetical protein